MTSLTAYARLVALGLPVIRTSEAAAVLGVSAMTAAQALRRLTQAGLLRPLRHGQVWVPQGPIDPWVALEFVSAPYPAYASLYSALFIHGVLSQVPAVHYAVTLGRTQTVQTSAGTYSLHQVAPACFGGFTRLPSGAQLATVEKALFDLAYFAATRSRTFARPPELELPGRLDHRELERWLAAIPSPRRAVQVRTALQELLRRTGSAGPHTIRRPRRKRAGPASRFSPSSPR
jgi:hypothetical protein